MTEKLFGYVFDSECLLLNINQLCFNYQSCYNQYSIMIFCPIAYH